MTFSKTPGGLTRHAPRLGEHSLDLLREAGLTEVEIEALLAARATSQADALAGDD